jgi:hypothetical protein
MLDIQTGRVTEVPDPRGRIPPYVTSGGQSCPDEGWKTACGGVQSTYICTVYRRCGRLSDPFAMHASGCTPPDPKACSLLKWHRELETLACSICRRLRLVRPEWGFRIATDPTLLGLQGLGRPTASSLSVTTQMGRSSTVNRNLLVVFHAVFDEKTKNDSSAARSLATSLHRHTMSLPTPQIMAGAAEPRKVENAGWKLTFLQVRTWLT